MTIASDRHAIEVTGLRKSYGDTLVLDGIDLTVPEGSVFALLGPNGAGKTTAVNIMSTLVRADGGTVRVAGHDVAREPNAVRKAIGLTGQFSAVDRLLTGTENLTLIADLYHVPRKHARRRTAELIERFDLVEAAGKPAMTYSGGMRRRLDLAMTLIGEPRVVFLDEPTSGLDPRSRRGMWEIIRELATGGTTVFLTTQYLEEADRLADGIALLDGGRLIAEGSAEQLKRLVPGGHVLLRFADSGALGRADQLLDATTRDDDELTLQVPGDDTVRSLRSVLSRLDSASIEVEELSVHTPDLDDVFLALTGRTDNRQASGRPASHPDSGPPTGGNLDMSKETVR